MSEVEVDCDICSECKDHAGFEETEDGEIVSNCCGAKPYDTDFDWSPD